MMTSALLPAAQALGFSLCPSPWEAGKSELCIRSAFPVPLLQPLSAVNFLTESFRLQGGPPGKLNSKAHIWSSLQDKCLFLKVAQKYADSCLCPLMFTAWPASSNAKDKAADFHSLPQVLMPPWLGDCPHILSLSLKYVSTLLFSKPGLAVSHHCPFLVILTLLLKD